VEVSGLPLATLTTTTLAKATPTSLTVPAGHRYYLAFASIYYQADANVATRIVTAYIDHGTPESHLAKFDVTASKNLRLAIGWSNAAYTDYLVAGVSLSCPIPLVAGDIFAIAVSAAQAGDDWSAILRYWDVVLST